MATFVGKLGVARSDILGDIGTGHCKAVIDVPESFVFAKGYHHSRTFSRELERLTIHENFLLRIIPVIR